MIKKICILLVWTSGCFFLFVCLFFCFLEGLKCKGGYLRGFLGSRFLSARFVKNRVTALTGLVGAAALPLLCTVEEATSQWFGLCFRVLTSVSIHCT